jgi:hypothetical protein
MGLRPVRVVVAGIPNILAFLRNGSKLVAA